jgi:hypothetical protein
MKKISIKTFYLIAVISIGLIGLAVGSTYAMFTTSAEINNPITISSNLTSNNDVMETFEVEIEPYKTVTQTININSGTVSNVNYAVWYLNNISNVDIGILSTNTRTTGVIKDAGSGTGCNIVLRNNSAEKKTITIGVATSKSSISLASNMTIVPQTVIGERQINTNAATYIKKLYSTTEKSTVTNNSITYNTSPSQLLMNDRKGSSSTGIDAGNIRYYGANPDNYVYFNCSNYNNPTASTCELWRIIGVFDGKIKIMRSENIGAYSWDTTASTINGGSGLNDWSTSKLMMLLNSGYTYLINNLSRPASLYWNRTSGSCYNAANLGATSCSFTSTGLKNDTTKNMIYETRHNIGAGTTSVGIYANQLYAKERGTTVYTGRPTTWTGKVVVPYASDYSYAVDFNKCSSTLYNYNNSACTSNNWMYNIMTKSGTKGAWTLTSQSNGNADAVFGIYANGGVAYGQGTRGGMNILPTLYLNPDTIITKGEGTKDKPYKIKTNNLAARITSLYESSSKTSVTNGSKTYQYDTTNSLMKDAAGHIRYYGASPNNYIYFNCSNYSSQTSTTCEKWRIIGYVDNKVKLIRGSQIGTFSWDNKNDSTGATLTYGKNDWTTARIMRLLNPSTYYTTDSNDNGYGQSLYWNAKSGTCFSDINNATKSCDFTSIGIKNTTTRNLISETKYYLGGSNTFSIYSNQMYDYERGKAVFTGRPTEWTGKVGLAYPSDYGYAADFRSCTQDLDNYNNSACTSKNWMKAIIAPNYGALINPHSDVSYSIWRINQNGGVGYNTASTVYGITPVIYLDPKLVIKSGTGTSSSPYQLSV